MGRREVERERGFWRMKMDGREGRKGVDGGGDGRAVNESGMDTPDRLADRMKTSHTPSNHTPSDDKGGSDHIGKFGGKSGAEIGEGAVQSPLMSESEIVKDGNGNGNESKSVKEGVDINTSLAELDKEMGIADLALQKAAQFLAGRYVNFSLSLLLPPLSLSYVLSFILHFLFHTWPFLVSSLWFLHRERVQQSRAEEVRAESRGLILTLSKHRFAAKEATMKAHHSRRLTYHSILILKPEPQPGVEGSVAPVAIVMDESERRTRSRLASGSGSGLGGDGVDGQAGVGKGDEGGEGERGIDGEEVRGKEVRISISHDGDYATAVCLAVDE